MMMRLKLLVIVELIATCGLGAATLVSPPIVADGLMMDRNMASMASIRKIQHASTGSGFAFRNETASAELIEPQGDASAARLR